MTGNAIRAMLDRIAGVYMAKIPEGAVRAWEQALDGIDDSAGADALLRHIRESEKAPRPSDIIKRVADMRASILPTESIKARMDRLNRASTARIADRVGKADQDEIRFQRWKLRQAVLRNDLTDELRAYFNRVLGVEEVVETINDIERHRGH